MYWSSPLSKWLYNDEPPRSVVDALEVVDGLEGEVDLPEELDDEAEIEVNFAGGPLCT